MSKKKKLDSNFRKNFYKEKSLKKMSASVEVKIKKIANLTT